MSPSLRSCESSWTGVRGARRRVGVGRVGVLPTHCPPTLRKVQLADPRPAGTLRRSVLVSRNRLLVRVLLNLCSAPSVKGIDAVLGKVHHPCFWTFPLLRSLIFGSSFTSSRSAKKDFRVVSPRGTIRSSIVSTFLTEFLQAPLLLDRHLLGRRCQFPLGLQFYFVLGVSLLGDTDLGADPSN